MDCGRVEGMGTSKESETVKESDLVDRNVYAGLSTKDARLLALSFG
jgi:hypothetical protein